MLATLYATPVSASSMTQGKLRTGGSSLIADKIVSFAVLSDNPLLLSRPVTLLTYSVMGAVVACRFTPSTVRAVGAAMAKPKCGTAVPNPLPPVAAATKRTDLQMSLLIGGMKSLVCIGAKNVCSTLFTRIATKFESKNVSSAALASVASFQPGCAGMVVAIGNSRLYG